MSKELTLDDITKICETINHKYLPDEQPFINAVDEQVEIHGESTPEKMLIEVFKSLLKTVDSEISEIESKVSISPTCYKGCAHCCYFPIIVTRLEAKLMINYINNLKEHDKSILLDHLGRYFDRNQSQITELCSLDFQSSSDFKEKYIRKQLSCPFLNTDSNTCMAYEVRPIPCRTYLNYANPKVCSDSFVPKEPFSYEFFHSFYMEELNVLLQDLYGDGLEVEGINYPNDLFEYDYLPKLLKEELV